MQSLDVAEDQSNIISINYLKTVAARLHIWSKLNISQTEKKGGERAGKMRYNGDSDIVG